MGTQQAWLGPPCFGEIKIHQATEEYDQRSRKIQITWEDWTNRGASSSEEKPNRNVRAVFKNKDIAD